MCVVPCTHRMFGRTRAGHLHLGSVHGRGHEGMVLSGALWSLLVFINV